MKKSSKERAIDRLIDKLSHAIDYFTGILTGLMVLFVFLNVVLRTFLNSGLTWSEELARYLSVYVTCIGAISAMHSNTHLGVDTLPSRVSPKVQLALYPMSRPLIAAIMCILVHGAFKMAPQNTQSRTAALGIPYSVLYFGGIITDIPTAILVVTNIVYAPKHPEEITDIVTIHNDDDDTATEAMEQAEELSDEGYVKRFSEQGGK